MITYPQDSNNAEIYLHEIRDMLVEIRDMMRANQVERTGTASNPLENIDVQALITQFNTNLNK